MNLFYLFVLDIQNKYLRILSIIGGVSLISMSIKTEKFLKAMKVIFANEGGYVNNKCDKGGETNLGITAATLKTANSNKITNITDVKQLTFDTAEDIYYQMYWIPSKSEDMNSPLDLIQFDVSINSGVKNANKMLQKAINKAFGSNILVVDGIIGKNTMRYLSQVSDTDIKAKQLSYIYLDIRASFYEDIIKRDPTQNVFRKGWMNRIQNLKNIIQKGY